MDYYYLLGRMERTNLILARMLATMSNDRFPRIGETPNIQ